jgi:uncharacterized glyoxalase superfamily protein PhnB
MIRSAIPLLHVSNFAVAQQFYSKLGFLLEFSRRADRTKSDPGYASIVRDGARLHLSSFPGDGASGSVINLMVDNVDALFDEFSAKHVPIAVAPVNQVWGTREMYVKDADGNSLRFISNRTNR